MNEKAVILGTGGHARVILSILFKLNIYKEINLFELGMPREGEQIMGVDVIPFSENSEQLLAVRKEHFFLAIGCNKQRKYYWELLIKKGLSLPNLISPEASIDDSADLGLGNVICSFTLLGPCVRIGNNNLINSGSIIEHESHVGNHCHVASRSVLAGRTSIGDQCFVGAGSTIIDKISVAHGTTLGAGACLTANVLDEGLTYVGVPARPLSRNS